MSVLIFSVFGSGQEPLPESNFREKDRIDSKLLGSVYLVSNTQSKRKLEPLKSDMRSIYDESQVNSATTFGTRGVFQSQSAAAKIGLRSVDKTAFRVPDVGIKSELDRINTQINNRYRVSLEPMDTAKLLKGIQRDIEPSKWIANKNFKSIVSGDSHRRNEYAEIKRGKDEPYHGQFRTDFRSRELEKELST